MYGQLAEVPAIGEPIGTLPALVFCVLAVMLTLAFAIAILSSALLAQAEATKQLALQWRDGGKFLIRLEQPLKSLPLSPNVWHRCQLQKGCYNSHWMVVVSLGLSENAENTSNETGNAIASTKGWASSRSAGNQRKSKRFCILLARDSVSEVSFRHLRLWMRLVAPYQAGKSQNQQQCETHERR